MSVKNSKRKINFQSFLISSYGFTLIELLVVIAIIGILAAVVWLTINPVNMVKKSRDAVRKSDLATLMRGLDLYMTDGFGKNNFELPGYHGLVIDRDSTANEFCGASAVSSTDGGWLVENLSSLCDEEGEADLSRYLSIIPVDPVNNVNYKYSYDSQDGKKYCLQTVLEESGLLWQIGTDIDACVN